MRNKYNRNILLRCVICGSAEHFEYNNDKSYVKCTLCNREYLGGEEELIEMHNAMIEEEVEIIKKEITKDAEKEIQDMFRKAFKGNKIITIK